MKAIERHKAISRRPAPRKAVRKALWFAILGCVALSQIAALQAGMLAPEIVRAVRDANLVVVGRVVGIIDSKPAAQTRRHLEAHWIQVERTIKGSDESGQRFAARPNGLRWEDGKSYVIFLDWTSDNWAEAIPQPLVEADEANIAAVAEEVAAQGGSVGPQRIVWMRHIGGWELEPTTEFIVTEDGAFEWKKRLRSGTSGEQAYETRTGKLSKGTIAKLIRRVEQAGPGPSADDAGTVSFRWLDEKGEPHFVSYSVPDQPPAVDLLEAVELLVGGHG